MADNDATVPWPDNVPITPTIKDENRPDSDHEDAYPAPSETQAEPPKSETPPPRSETPPPRSETPPRSESSPPKSETPPPRSETPPPTSETPPSAETPPPKSETPPPQSSTPPEESHTPPPEYAQTHAMAAYSGGSDGQVNVICTTNDEEDIKPDPSQDVNTESPRSLEAGYVRVELKEKPNDYIELSICACVLNFVFGVIAFNYSLKAQKSWKNGDRRKAKRQGMCALGWSLMSLVIIALIIVLVIWFEVVEKEVPAMEIMDATTMSMTETPMP